MTTEFSSIRVIDHTYGEITRHATRDEWDRDDTYTSHNIEGIKLVDENDYSDLTVPFKVEPDKTYYLLSVIYDTGDSFGRDEGRIEFIELYIDLDLAKKNQAAIEDHNKKYRDSYYDDETPRLIIENQVGTKIDYYPSWYGYFERLSEVRINSVMVELGEVSDD
jgi:hypothetical protein